MLNPRQITVKNVNKLLHNTLYTFERHFSSIFHFIFTINAVITMMKIMLMKKQNHRDVRDWPRLQTQVSWLQAQALPFLPCCISSQQHQAKCGPKLGCCSSIFEWNFNTSFHGIFQSYFSASRLTLISSLWFWNSISDSHIHHYLCHLIL